MIDKNRISGNRTGRRAEDTVIQTQTIVTNENVGAEDRRQGDVTRLGIGFVIAESHEDFEVGIAGIYSHAIQHAERRRRRQGCQQLHY